jgi:hypothetical protein
MGSVLQPGQTYTQQLNLIPIGGNQAPTTSTNQSVYGYLNSGGTNSSTLNGVAPQSATPTSNMINGVLGTNGSTSLTSGLIGNSGLGNINPASYTTNSAFAGSSYTPKSSSQMAYNYLNHGKNLPSSSGVMGGSTHSAHSAIGGNTTASNATPNLNIPDSQLCASLVSSINSKEYVYFYTMPSITEAGSVIWKTMEMVQAPGGILSYGGTKSRTFTLAIKFVSRTSNEAGINAYFLQMLRGWKMPYFGSSNKKLLGAPPPVLYFTAFSDASSRPTYVSNYNKIPVVIESVSPVYDGDSDFIRTICPVTGKQGDPFPVIMKVNVVLKEAHAPIEYLTFNLTQYRLGNLAGF